MNPRHLRAPLALLVVAAAAGHAPEAGALSLLGHEAGAHAFDSVAGARAVDVRDPWNAQATHGHSTASFDLALGRGHSFASTSAAAAGLSGAVTMIGFAFTLHNGGDSAVGFEAGAVGVAVDAGIANLTGTGPSGSATLLGGFFRTSGAHSAQGLFGYRYFDTPLTPAVDLFTTDVNLTGDAAVDVRAATTSAIDLVFSFGAFSIDPGRSVTFEFEFGADVKADTGGLAVVDLTDSATLYMRLPAGVGLDAGRPLDWVSVVPEPASAGSMALGLALLLGSRRLRARAH